jgi:hypothetical protein
MSPDPAGGLLYFNAQNAPPAHSSRSWLFEALKNNAVLWDMDAGMADAAKSRRRRPPGAGGHSLRRLFGVHVARESFRPQPDFRWQSGVPRE